MNPQPQFAHGLFGRLDADIGATIYAVEEANGVAEEVERPLRHFHQTGRQQMTRSDHSSPPGPPQVIPAGTSIAGLDLHPRIQCAFQGAHNKSGAPANLKHITSHESSGTSSMCDNDQSLREEA